MSKERCCRYCGTNDKYLTYRDVCEVCIQIEKFQIEKSSGRFISGICDKCSVSVGKLRHVSGSFAVSDKLVWVCDECIEQFSLEITR